ncbi:non-ribosomal peptide synthetase [Thermogemmatispora onikobensis]|uniref:non-ribosomal peptide synthetase n=1 Tax=Thermogemmatispora onikobensis TaxID=732234 RepID=UPI001FE0B423|nr:non-ribosomal peptide synthetase [Thermogemmatispora onikobensis]
MLEPASGSSLSYQTLNCQANQLARLLLSLGLSPSSPVALLLPPSPSFFVSLLAVLKAGSFYLPLDPSTPPARLTSLLSQVQPSFLLTCQSLAPSLPSLPADTTLLCLDSPDTLTLLASLPSDNLPWSGSPDQLAYLIFTSGSTGSPKAVSISHANLLASTLSRLLFYHHLPPSRFLLLSPCSFDSSVAGIFWSLCSGATLVLPPSPLSDHLSLLPSLLQQADISHLLAVPSLYRFLLELSSPAQLASLRCCIVAGEPCPQALVHAHYARLPHTPLFNEYGPSEATVWASVHLCSPSDPFPSSPIGRPLPHCRLYVLDPSFQPVPIGVPGELFIGGPSVSPGYFRQPSLSASHFLPDPFSSDPHARLYRTGDLVRWLPDGSLLFLGRLDQQVKLRGFRIELGEIEALLSSHPALQEAAVLLHQPSSDDPSSARLVAFVSPRPGTQLTPSTVRSFLSERLPAYMVPASFIILDSLPHTPTGKIDRLSLAALPLPEMSEAESEEKLSPSNSIETTIAQLWEELLQVHSPSLQDNFFSLGGHSLLAAQLFARIEQRYGVRLNLSTLFKHPTIAELAKLIEKELQHAKAGAAEERSRETPADPAALPALPHHDPEQPAPLSYGQQQLWFLSQLFKERPLYTIPLVIRIAGDLDEKALQQSLEAFVRRHHLWRSSFPSLGETPAQVVQPCPALPLPVTDFSSLSAPEQFTAARSLIEQQIRLPFDLSQVPLLRAFLLRFSPQLHWLGLVIHHIIADAQTLYTVLPTELEQLYKAYSQGQQPDLLAPRCQYADYVLWEQAHLTPERLEQLFAFWQEYLHNVPTTLALPADHPRPPTFHYRGGSYYFSVSPELASDLHQLARQEGVSLYTVLLAAFQILLYRYSQQEDFLIGTFSTNRHKRPEFEEIPGYFLNAVPLRSCITDPDHLSGHELIQRTREALAQTLAHDDLPLPLLVRRLHSQWTATGNPLFQVAMAMNSYRRLASNAWQIQELAIDNGTSRFDLTLSLEERANGTLTGCFEYSQDLFEEETIARLARHWQTVLSSLISDPSRSLASFPLLSDEERLLLASFSSSPQPLPPAPAPAIHLLFEAQAHRAPSSCALLEPASGSSLSYQTLNCQANQLARLLLSLGLSANTPVPLFLSASSSFVVGLLAILKAGGCFVPLDPTTPPARLQALLDELQPPLLLTTQSLITSLPPLATSCLVLCLDATETQAQLASLPADNLPWSGSPDQLAYLIFTSGSTGSPKAVSISHANLMASLTSRLEYYKSLPPRVHVPLLSLTFDSALAGVFWTLCVGGKVILLAEEQKRNLSQLPAFLEQAQASHLLVVPSLYRQILEDAAPSQLASLRCVIIGGEACPQTLVREHYARLPHTPLFNEYGPSEATVWASVHLCSPSDSFPSSPIGRPLPHCRLYVLDPSFQPVPIGVPGELFIGGPSVSPGYFRQPSLSASRFLPDPFSSDPHARLYRTGDLVRWLPDGSLLFLGRLDQQVKLRGFRIELGEIEALLSSHPALQEAAVLLHQPSSDDPSSARLVAFVSPRPGTQLTPSTVRSFLSERLPAYMVPASFIILDSLPHTPTGKIDRQALASLPAPAHESEQEGEATPRTLLEQQLMQIWEELLNVQPIGTRDNFFEIGGHSLLAARLFARIEQQLGKQLPLSLFFQEPTIERLAKAIEEGASQEDSRTPIIALQRQGKKRPLFYLHGDWTGGAFYCIELAKHLGEDQPFYAVEPYRFPQEAPPPSFEEMAAAHIEAIRRIQPSGPYRLAGWCNGGLVAYEMARQLQAMGEKVELLVLIDPTAPEHGWSRARLACSFIRVLGTLLQHNEQQQLEHFRRWRYRYSLWRYQLARWRKGQRENAPPPPNEGRQHWTSTCSWILTRYRSGPYYGDITFFWAAEEERWRRKPWLAFARRHQQEGRGRIDSQELPGTHITSRTTYLAAFAAELKRRLDAMEEEDDNHPIDKTAVRGE